MPTKPDRLPESGTRTRHYVGGRNSIERVRRLVSVGRLPAWVLPALAAVTGAELAEEDVDVLTRQALMGHGDPRSTEIHTHLAMRKLAKTVERANPLRRICTPVTALARELQRD